MSHHHVQLPPIPPPSTHHAVPVEQKQREYALAKAKENPNLVKNDSSAFGRKRRQGGGKDDKAAENAASSSVTTNRAAAPLPLKAQASAQFTLLDDANVKFMLQLQEQGIIPTALKNNL